MILIKYDIMPTLEKESLFSNRIQIKKFENIFLFIL